MAKFEPGRSGNPKGRPASPYSMSRLRAAMGEDLPKIIGILRERAMDGDMRAIELVMSRCLGPLRAADPPVTLPLTGNPGEDSRTIAQAAGRGEISPSTAQQLMGAVASQARVLELAELEGRIAALEARTHGNDVGEAA